MILLALLLGYSIGSLPTAGILGRVWGVDLRNEGSANPGTRNALRLSGPGLAATVLIVESAKGYGAVQLGAMVLDPGEAIAAGVGAVAGNVYNIWYRFGGGKGLGISLGVLLAAWPAVVPVVLAVIVVTVLITRSSGMAAISAMMGLVVAALLWSNRDWPTGGVEPTRQLIWLALGLTTIMAQKHWRDFRLKRAGLL